MRRVSYITVITTVCALTVSGLTVLASGAASAQPAAHSSPGHAVAQRPTVAFRGVPGSATRITANTPVASTHRQIQPDPVTDIAPEALLFPDSTTGPIAQSGAASDFAAPALASPISVKSSQVRSAPGLIKSINGLSELDSAAVNDGREVTPPDQGLCSGRDPSLAGNPMVVWEMVNIAVREMTPDGTQVRPDMTLAQLFRDPFDEGDPRCFWDQSTQSFIFTEIGFPLATGPSPSLENTTVDIAVLNHLGFASYQFDTSLGGQCLGDQPQVGFNLDAVIVSTNQFCGPRQGFVGPIVLVISLPQLALEAATVNDAVFGPLSLPGSLAISLDPAHGPGLVNAYMVNSFPFTATGARNPNASTLGLWTITNTAAVTSGTGTPVISGTVIPSETYGFPVRAASTGSGTVVRVIPGTLNGQPHNFPITSEAFLAANDSRINSAIEAKPGFGGIQLYAALETALTPAGDSAARDGVAWFQVNALGQSVVNQGYIAQAGAYLLYPVIAKTVNGPPTVAFSMTGPAINPSSAFSVVDSGIITIVGAGTGPHLSFSDAPPFNRARWGDYSAAAVLPDNSGIWFGEEYIPPASDQADRDNWGTSLFEVSR